MKVLNFFGGAGIGKSTIAADVFSKLKRKGYKTELVGEYAKWLWYQNATEIVEDQLYLLYRWPEGNQSGAGQGEG